MSKQELVGAYVRGDLSRRQFVRQLTALGVGLGAATTYAAVLGPASASAEINPSDDFYYGGPPTARTDPASATRREVTLRGTVNANRAVTDVAFRVVDKRGRVTMVSAGQIDGLGEQAVSATITGVHPGKYTYAVVATNAYGSATGAEQAFKVPAPRDK